jgi:hypothetical protein
MAAITANDRQGDEAAITANDRQGDEDALLEAAMKLAAAEKTALEAAKEKKANENLLEVEIETVAADDDIDMSVPPPRCGHCNVPNSNDHRLKLCAGCSRVFYCNAKCQSSHADQHKSTCSPRVIHVNTTDKRQLVKEGVELQRLAREIVEQKIRPDMLREDVIDDLADWLRDMLNGPALPLNKSQNFMEDILSDVEFVADAEIYVESHPGCHGGLFERNRKDELKKKFYPTSIKSELRVNEDVLSWRCQSMVVEFCKRRGVTDETLFQKATDEFYNFYTETILTRRPKIYNSCTGIGAVMGDMRFMKQSEDIVLYHLGLIKELPEDIGFVRSASPPIHTVFVFLIAMSLCIWALPTVESLDRYATIETFTTPIFKEGLLNLSPLALGVIRMVFAIICMVITIMKMNRCVNFKLTYLSGSKLRKGTVDMKGMRTQGFFTSWAWNLLGFYFFLSGTISLLSYYGREDVLHVHPWIVRGALIAFEIAAPCAILTSFVVTYALWPQAYKTHGASGTIGFKGVVNSFQHNVNTLMVLLEVCLLGGVPVKISHAALAPIFAGCYQLFLWCMTNYWMPKHGPLHLYFFMDTTLGKRTTIFMVVLLVVMLFFFSAFALLEMAVTKIEEGNHGALPNIACVFLISSLLMKFKD